VNYCEIPDVRFALTEAGVEAGTNTAADMDDETINDSIAEASSQVDFYIGGPYRPDLGDVVPDTIKYLTRDVAAFLATCTWRKSKDFAAMDPVLLRYNWAIQSLISLQTGANSNVIRPTNPDSSAGATVVNQYPFTLFYPWQFDLWGRSYYGGSDYMWPGRVAINDQWRNGYISGPC
jgi:phage gp36-like protein